MSHSHDHSKDCCDHKHSEGEKCCCHNHAENPEKPQCSKGSDCCSCEDADDPDEHHSGCSCSHDHEENPAKSQGSKGSDCCCSDGSHDHHDHHSGCGCCHNHAENPEKPQCSKGSDCCSCEDADDPDEHHSGCGCSHEKSVNSTSIILLIVATVLFIAALFLPINWVKIVLFAASALIAGYDLFIEGLKKLFKFQFEENVLLLIAVFASFCLGEYPEACIVTILFKLGSYIESYAIAKSKKNMEALTAFRPDFATIKSASGNYEKVAASTISVGDTIYLMAGDRLSNDCVIIGGDSSIDTSALTGEAIPQFVGVGDNLLSGSVNLSGLLTCRVTKTFKNSTASQIVELVYSSTNAKGSTESFITRISKVYTPIVIILALAIAIIPPLFSIGTFHDFIMRSLIFLVASCPCALVISIPLSFFASIGAVSKKGVLVKGSMFIEKLAKVDAVAFDKTGTLTSGTLQVEKIVFTSKKVEEATALSLLCSLERVSTHPIAVAITAHLSGSSPLELTNLSEVAGFGITANFDDKRVISGSKNMMIKENIDTDNLPPASVYLAIAGEVVCYVTIKEEIANASKTIVTELSKSGVERVIMLTGDNEANAAKVAQSCGIEEVYSSLLPAGKVAQLEKIRSDGHTVLFVGDGINDAPVLACADVGMSMGFGSEIANVSSDVILSSNNLASLPQAIRIARRGMSTVRVNIIFALAVKVLVLVLGGFGLASMWLAVFADIGVTIITILNAIRKKKY